MPILIENLTALVIALVFIALLANGVVIGLTIVRRQRREKYFLRIDDLRQHFAPVIAGMLDEKVEYAQCLAKLKQVSGLDRDYVLEQLCMASQPTEKEIPLLRRLCEDLGLVTAWQRHLSGRFDVLSVRDALARPEGVLQRFGRLGFLLRAKSAENLGTIRHKPSWPLLVKALQDAHADVQVVAVRALAAIGEPESFPALVKALHEAVVNPSSRLSLRSVKSALVSFPLGLASGLLPSLKHAHRRIRFMATDVIREMVENRAAREEEFALRPEEFSPEMAEIFLSRLCFDENPDVRARSAPVLAHLEDARVVPVLVTLLGDPQWFVRLHAVRALAKRKFLPQAPALSRRLTDGHWMVREAATRALLVFGRIGVDELSGHFLDTEDRYSREQVADEMQRAGLIPTFLAQYAEEAGGRGKKVLEQLAQMGTTSYLMTLVGSSTDRGLRKKFLSDFGRHANLQIRAWVKQVASQDNDPELRALARASANLTEPPRRN